jgi:hypothetical protein
VLGWKRDFARRQVLLQASGSKQEQDQVPKWVVGSFWGISRAPVYIEVSTSRREP